MRKIEKAMNDAIRAGRSWGQANTQIIVSDVQNDLGADLPEQKRIRVYLHGHMIADIFRSDVLVTVRFDHCGWQTVTTKSRINAIAQELGVLGVYQRNHVWRFDDGQEFDIARIQLRSLIAQLPEKNTAGRVYA